MENESAAPWRLIAAPWVRSAHDRDGVILLELRKGSYLTFNAVGATIWRLLENGASRDEVVAGTVAAFDAPRERVERDVDQMIARFLERQLVVPYDVSGGPPLSAPSNTAGACGDEVAPATEAPFEPPRERPAVAWILPALAGLLATDVCLRLAGFGRCLEVVRRLKPRRRTTAPLARARSLAESVNRAAAFYFRRAWCLHRSLVTVLLLRAAGFPATMAVGACRLPFGAHAWVEIGGEVVNDSSQVKRRFLVLDRV